TFSSTATRQLHDKIQILAGTATSDNVGLVGYGVAWKGNAALAWEHREWVITWNANVTGSYWINADHSFDLNTGSKTIPTQIYHDLFVRYRPAGVRSIARLSGLELRVGVENVFDKIPPLLASINQTSFYDYYGDPRLRRYSLGLTAAF